MPSETNIVDDIFLRAKKGMLMDVKVIAGETGYEEVTKLFGTPENIEETSVGDFADFSERQITIGFRNDIAFNLRSFNQELQGIHYQEVIDRLGEPGEIKFFKDTEYDQIILIYQVNAGFQLKWILDKPTNKEPNPTLHHISVVALEPSTTLPEKIESMSLDEKIGQMIFAGVEGTEPNKLAEQLIQGYKVGGIIFNSENITDSSKTLAYLNALKAKNSFNKVPLFFGIDQEGGRISKLPGNLIDIPSNLEVGKKNDPTFSFELGAILGKLVKAYGFNIDFAPVLDVNSNPKNPVIGDRSFANNPNLVSELGVATMKGIQSVNIIPTIKHFPGHGDTSVDSHLELPTVDKSIEELEELELIPFKKAINEGAEMVMVAHILLPKIDQDFPSSMSRVIMTDILRKKLGYDGIIITDDMTMDAIAGNYDIGSAAVKSVVAGSDIIMVAHDYEKIVKVISALKEAVEQGEIQEERINDSVTRILQIKEKYKMKDTQVEQVNTNALRRELGQVLESQ